MAHISNGNRLNNGHARDGQNYPAQCRMEITIFAQTRHVRISDANVSIFDDNNSLTMCYPAEPPGLVLSFDERCEILSLSGTFLPSLTAPLLGVSRLSLHLGPVVSLRSGGRTFWALGPVTVITALFTNVGLPPPPEEDDDDTSSGEMLPPSPPLYDPPLISNGNGHMFPPPN